MKQIILIVALILITTSLTWAQTDKGRWLVGTQLGDFSYQDQNNQRFFSASLTPSAGYFMANGLLIGVGVPLSVSSSKYSQILYPDPTISRITNTSTGYGLSPFIRYYLGSSKLKPYLGVGYTYGLTQSKSTATSTLLAQSKGHYSVITPTLGVAYFVSRTVALNAGLEYNIRKDKTEYSVPVSRGTTESDSKLFTLGIGFQLFFGQ